MGLILYGLISWIELIAPLWIMDKVYQRYTIEGSTRIERVKEEHSYRVKIYLMQYIYDNKTKRTATITRKQITQKNLIWNEEVLQWRER